MRLIYNERSFILIICICIVLSITPFFIYRIYLEQYSGVLLNGCIILGYLLVFINLSIYKELKSSRFYLLLLTYIGILSTIFINGTHNVYWIYPASAITFYLYSPVKSLIISFTLCTLVLVLVFILEAFKNYILLTLFSTYFIVNCFSYVYAQRVQAQHLSLKKSTTLTLLFNNILEMVVSSKSLNDILKFITTGFESQHSKMLCSILLVDTQNNSLKVTSAPSLPSFYNKAIDNIPIAEGIGACGTSAFRGERVIINDINTHEFFHNYSDIFHKTGLKSCWAEPIKNSNGEVLGTFAIYQKKIASPSYKEIKLLEQFAHLASISIEKDRANKLIWRQANFDVLTQLPNRNRVFTYLSEIIEQSKKDNTKQLLAFIDLDNFKYVNDHYGHSTGDKLLIEVAQRINQNVRKNDFVARLGGDEFIIVCENLINTEAINDLSASLLTALSSPYLIDNNDINISASIGITIYPDNANDINGLLNKADQAMYKVKNSGKNDCYVFHEPV